MSIEPNTDFTGNGKCYLQGLAVTDSPASTGTTRLKFSMGESEIEHDYSTLEVLQHSDFIFTHPNKTQSKNNEAEAKSLINQLFNLFSNPSIQQATEASDTAEDEPMTEEQYNALMGKFDGITSQVSSLEEKFNSLESKVEKFTAEDDDGGDDCNEEGEETNSVTNEQFSQLNDTITGLTEKFTGIETKFNALSQEDENQEPDPAGQGESVSLV